MVPMKGLFFKNNYQEPKFWYFNDGKNKFKRKAKLTKNQDRFELTLDVPQDEVEKFEKEFFSITTNDSHSRLTLFRCRGYKNMYFPYLSKVPIKIIPSYVIQQAFGNSNIPFSTNNLEAKLVGMELFFDRNLLKFNEKERAFEEKKNLYHSIKVTPEFKIILNSSLEIDNFQPNAFKANHTSSVELFFDKQVNYGVAIDFFKTIEEFFNFVSSEIYDEKYFYSRRSKRGKHNYLSEIIYDAGRRNPTVENKNVYDILFNINDISNSSEIIRNWILNYPKKIERIWRQIKYLRMYSVSEDDRFLILVKTIEGIHRLAEAKDTEEKINKHRERVRAIVSQIEKNEDKKIVKQALEFKYESTLRERLRLISQLTLNFQIPPLSKEIINKIVNTRNKLIHNLSDKNDRTYLSFSEMYDANNIMAMQIKVVIMIILRISDKEIKKIVDKSNQFKSYYRDGDSFYYAS